MAVEHYIPKVGAYAYFSIRGNLSPVVIGGKIVGISGDNVILSHDILILRSGTDESHWVSIKKTDRQWASAINGFVYGFGDLAVEYGSGVVVEVPISLLSSDKRNVQPDVMEIHAISDSSRVLDYFS